MKKDTSWLEDFNSMMKHLSKKKNQSIKDLEQLKEQILININSRIDKLYWKKDSVNEVKLKRKELRKLRVVFGQVLLGKIFGVCCNFLFLCLLSI